MPSVTDRPSDLEPGLSHEPSILAAIDLGAPSRVVLEAVPHLAPPDRAWVHVVHALPRPDPVDDLEGGTDVPAPALPEPGVSEARSWIEARCGDVGIPVERVRVHLRTGKPHAVVRNVAREADSDLVVLGGRVPRRPLDGLLGSTSERVIRTVSVPCLLINRELQGTPRRIMVATDFSRSARRAMEVAVAWAALWARTRPDGEVTRLELVQIADFARPGYRASDRSGDLARWARELEGTAGPGTEIGTRVVSYPLAAEGIHEMAGALMAHMVFMGTRGHGPLLRTLFGSVTSEVVRTLRLPLVVVPPVRAE